MACRNCGYSLEGLHLQSVCPECGAPNPQWADIPRLRRRLRRWWVAGVLTSLAMPWFVFVLSGLLVSSYAAWVFVWFAASIFCPVAFASKFAILHRAIEPREFMHVTVLRFVFHVAAMVSLYFLPLVFLVLVSG